mmetsp:Transcript_49051/g.154016  ORF Transcript_49051/g.154016 Transcript_49051/m.154016 type:complete len:133 (+) Transcript_49051:302-700(+)
MPSDHRLMLTSQEGSDEPLSRPLTQGMSGRSPDLRSRGSELSSASPAQERWTAGRKGRPLARSPGKTRRDMAAGGRESAGEVRGMLDVRMVTIWLTCQAQSSLRRFCPSHVSTQLPPPLKRSASPEASATLA